MKRTLSKSGRREAALITAGIALIAGTYGLVRLAYGLFLPDIEDSLALGSATAGYLSSGASAAYCAGAVIALVAPGRPRLLVAGALATASIGSLGMAVAATTTLFVPMTILASTGAGLASPGMVAVVARNVPASRAERARTVVNSGTGPGLVAAGLLALLLADWRHGFLIGAAFTAAAGLGVLLLDRLDAPTAATSSAKQTGQTTPTGQTTQTGQTTPTGQRAGRWLLSLRRPTAGALLLGAASAVVWTYGRAHLTASGMSDSASVVAWIGIGLGGLATAFTSRATTSLGARRAWRLTTGATAVAVGLLAIPGPLPIAALACALFGWGFVAATAALITWTGDLQPAHAPAGTSVVFIALVVGQAAGSAVAGALADGAGLSVVFLLAAGVALLAACCGRRAS